MSSHQQRLPRMWRPRATSSNLESRVSQLEIDMLTANDDIITCASHSVVLANCSIDTESHAIATNNRVRELTDCVQVLDGWITVLIAMMALSAVVEALR